jgi:uncharacterized membrane protein YhaH (DUF805 family)
LFCIHCGTRVGEITEAAAREMPVQTVNPYAVPPVQPAQQQINVNIPPPQYTSASGSTEQNKNAWQYFCDVWKKYAVFKGRARRAEFWWFVVFSAIISIILGLIDGYMGLYILPDVGLLSTIYPLVAFLPSWGVMVRRFHDVDKRAWFCLVPIYGWIVLPCTAGTEGPNRFGPDPKQTN